MAKQPSKKIQPLRLYLLKKSVKQFEDAVRKDVPTTKYAVKDKFKVQGVLFLRKPSSHPVDWREFVQPGLKTQLPQLETTAHAAVLFLAIDSRIVALVFGTGRYLMLDTAYETDFGLRSTLNAVDPKTLDQLDVNWFGEMVVQKRVQVSRQSTLAAFEIDVNRERFRSLTGRAKDPSFGTRLHGAEGGFGVHARIGFDELVDHCKECLKVYASKNYQTAFPKHDDFSVLRDAATQDKLDAKLLVKLRQRDEKGIYLSPPQIIEYDDFEGFSFSPKGEVHPELNTSAYFASAKDFSSLTLERLKSHRVYLKSALAVGRYQWSLYKCIVCEFKIGKDLFVLWNGQWCRVSDKFSKQVRAEVASIPLGKTSLPATTKVKNEGPFLAQVASQNASLALMDQDEIWCDNAGSGIEACDLFSMKGQFIHVKRRAHGACGLSHLFAQGRNSAEAFLRDDDFRSKLRDKLTVRGAKFGKKIPTKRPKPESFEVVYAVMGKKRGKFIKELPFFSQLTLSMAARDLHAMGFKISYVFIEAPE